MAPKVLVVLTNVGKIKANNHPIGWYLPEFAHPYEVLSETAEIITASPNGGLAPLDPSSIEAFKSDEVCQKFFHEHRDLWENTQPLDKFIGRASEFDAIFFPGGHGPMFDLVADKNSIQIIEEFYKAGKIVAAVCHGPAAFINVKINGQYLLQARHVTSISNDEEEFPVEMPFSLEDQLKKIGGHYSRAAEKWGETVIVDGQIITGQNPASSKGVAEAIAKAIQ